VQMCQGCLTVYCSLPLWRSLWPSMKLLSCIHL